MAKRGENLLSRGDIGFLPQDTVVCQKDKSIFFVFLPRGKIVPGIKLWYNDCN